MPNRMSEDMSDRMPEDVPVRTCINVMVGITRSKVIFPHPYPHSTRFMPLVNLSHSARFTPGNGCTLRCPRALFAGHGSRAL